MSVKDSKGHREALIKTAIDFLSHPQVRESSTAAKKAFLESRGLTTEEIEFAFSSTETSKHNTFPSGKLQRVPELPPNNDVSSRTLGLTFQSLLTKGFLTVGCMSAGFLAMRNYVLPIVQRWIEEMTFVRENRFEELRHILTTFQETHREHCGRMERMFYATQNNIREFQTRNEEILNDHHEEIKKLLLSIKEVLERQAQAQSPRLEELRARRDAPCSPIRESSISPLSSERGTPIPTGDHTGGVTFSGVSLTARSAQIQQQGQQLETAGSIPRDWLSSQADRRTDRNGLNSTIVGNRSPRSPIAETDEFGETDLQAELDALSENAEGR